jgi:hypothetical protein
MANQNGPLTSLPEELLKALREPCAVLVTTVSTETGLPVNNLISWAYAPSETAVRIATDNKGLVARNVRGNGKMLITVFAGQACWSIEGGARIISEEMPGCQLKLACSELAVEAVRNITFWGGVITAAPQFDVTYDKALKAKLDGQVMAALQSL